MRIRVTVGACISATVIVAGLMGCAIVDQYSSRAIVYNLEAEKAQEQAMLLNVVRAYLGRPMQFTTVSTITGTASASGSASYQFPLNVPFGPTSVGFPPVVPNAAFGGSLSGGPAFTVPVLDTQEFYRGILKAIPGQIWDLYIQANYPRDLLFNLFVEKVVMQRATPSCPSGSHIPSCEFVFSNNVGRDIQIDLFQALGDYLLALGLTTQLTDDAATVPFENPQNINVRFVGDPAKENPKEAEVLGAPGGSGTEGLAAASSYHLCFTPLTVRDTILASPSLCGKKAKKQAANKPDRGGGPHGGNPPAGNAPTGQIKSSGSATIALRASDEFIDRLIRIAGEDDYEKLSDSLRHFRSEPVHITIYMRHTEGMIYYLGELVRRQYAPANPREIFVKYDPPYTMHDTATKCPDVHVECAHIFHLYQGAVPEPGDVISAFYDGRWFSLPPGSASDWSSLTFDFLKQQIALNSSAKSLPQSSVLTTIGP